MAILTRRKKNAYERKWEHARRKVWTIPDFPTDLRGKFTGCIKILGTTIPGAMIEAVEEWMINHEEELKQALESEFEKENMEDI